MARSRPFVWLSIHIHLLLAISAFFTSASAQQPGYGSVFPSDSCTADDTNGAAAQQPDHLLSFDTVTLTCIDCTRYDPVAVADASGEACTCPWGYRVVRGWARALSCFPCPDGEAPTLDQSECMACGNGTVYDASVKECVCPAGAVTIERDLSYGLLEGGKACQPCDDPQRTFPGPTQPARVYECVPCGDEHMAYEPTSDPRQPYRCVCDEKAGYRAAGAGCVEQTLYQQVDGTYPVAAATEVIYRDFIDDDDRRELLRSDTLKHLYIWCAVGCIKKRPEDCHCLAHLCALQLYETRATVCRYLDVLNRNSTMRAGAVDPGQLEGLPWVYYRRSNDLVLKDKSVQWEYSFRHDVKNQRLRFWLARYSLEGEWLGWVPLGSHLTLCDGGPTSPTQHSPRWTEFGGSFEQKCEVPLQLILDCGRHPELYDLFIENPKGELIAVPVRVVNLLDFEGEPNKNKRPSDTDDDILVRRFFVCEAVTGRTGAGAYQSADVPQIVRWASKISVEIVTQEDNSRKIYVPVVNLAYSEHRLDAAIFTNQDDSSSSSSSNGGDTSAAAASSSSSHPRVTRSTKRLPAEFRAEFATDSEEFWTVFSSLTGVGGGLAMVLCLYIVMQYYRRNPADPAAGLNPEPAQGFYRAFPPALLCSLRNFFACLGLFVFGWLLIVSSYWLFFYKLQEEPYVLLPSGLMGGSGRAYLPFDVTLILGYCFCFLATLFAILQQSQAFVVVLDREPFHRPVSNVPPSPAMRLSTPIHPSQQQQLPQPSKDEGTRQQQQQQQQQVAGGTGGVAGGGGGADVGGAGRGPSAWRSLFVLNELNERQTFTYTNPQVTWMAVLFFLEGLEWKNAGRWRPQMDDLSHGNAPYNPFLQIAISGLVWVLVVLLELVGQRLLSVIVPNPLDMLVDLCALSNTSLLILNEPQHGWYIHGAAPGGISDVPTADLLVFLKQEGGGLLLKRGLVPDDAHRATLQTFEVFLTVEFKRSFYSVSGTLFSHRQRQKQQKKSPGASAAAAAAGASSPSLPATEAPRARASSIHGGAPLDRLLAADDPVRQEQCRQALQGLVGETIEDVVNQRLTQILKMTGVQKIWKPAPDMRVFSMPLFYEDRGGRGWTSVLLAGGEGVFVATQILQFWVVFRYGQSPFVAAVCSYILDRVLRWLRRFLGAKNMAFKCLPDDRFLL
ncbi:unnamed protein product [Vitrella brassicaformis CCMP3155]|uniref:Tyrosine-protein kinase ephrin type A/B receptor-like domain-containing protein n=2 Tax=Vitrella brassicaformis TaxID=1169539 RepID=A0A0G4GSC9_VITBC|nr:unnamed protein product [Vitrella brassicaformis CCMP3155]|eukprot:CEM33534.1 unnamed protein product [Vitrella brassicaformis CCMP3155]